MAGRKFSGRVGDEGPSLDNPATDTPRPSTSWLRRRSRWLQAGVVSAVTVTTVLGIVLGQELISGSSSSAETREPSDSSAVTGLACSGALLQSGTLDYWGSIDNQTLKQAVDSFIDSSNGESASISHLSADAAVAMIQRQDGSATAELDLQRDDGVWYVTTYEACAGEQLWPRK